MKNHPVGYQVSSTNAVVGGLDAGVAILTPLLTPRVLDNVEEDVIFLTVANDCCSMIVGFVFTSVVFSNNTALVLHENIVCADSDGDGTQEEIIEDIIFRIDMMYGPDTTETFAFVIEILASPSFFVV